MNNISSSDHINARCQGYPYYLISNQLFTALEIKGGTGAATLPVPHQSSTGYKLNVLWEFDSNL